ncbi:murein hydrolase activator EnvC family protein [Faunimonas sp. B44]|uniref:murein hydrolase activator EnvC family protein n=1 Tax=Faunimonas sp. B44 TaxID=3461493 RepID=UPI0040441A78
MTNRLPLLPVLSVLAGALLLAPVAGIVHAQAARTAPDPAPAGGAAVPDGSDAAALTAEERKRVRQSELESIRRSIEVSEKRQAALQEEIAGIEDDRARLSADLIATAERLRRTESEIAAIEERLERLHANEDGVRQSLKNRRGVLVEVLMALQRMGRTPPPALVSRPEDALAAIRGSILASAVLPDIRVEAEALAADLQELTQLTARIQQDRDRLRARYAALGEERSRIDLLVRTKRDQRRQTEAALRAEQEKAGALAAKAESLNQLIGTIEKEVGAAASARDEAAKTAALSKPKDQAEARRRMEDTSRMAPTVRFADAKGLLAKPVTGETRLTFGAPDGLGGKAQGLSLAARPGSSVVAPADGWVVYAGPFRTYGQVLILNAGDGYHIVLAGMERIDAALGQFVLSGEPVAVMGSQKLASIGDFDPNSAQPLLYVEFRKDGGAIDPTPWWRRDGDDEVRG